MIDSIGDIGLGLEFDIDAVPTGIKPNSQSEFKNYPGLFKLAGIKFRDVSDAIEELHESTIDRLKNRQDYRPKNLEKVLPKLNLK